MLTEKVVLTAPFTYHEKELLERLSQDDEAAFKAIYLHYWKRLYALAFVKLGSKQSAEDIVQEVFAGLWIRRKKQIILSLEAYLATAVKYSIFRELAGHRKRPVTGLSSDVEMPGDNIVELRLLQQMLDKDIGRLPQKCKLVFQYSRSHGMSNKEIAGHLNVSEKAVEKHITKAIRRLRNSMHQLMISVPFLLQGFF